jgi:hypothetical protein
MYVSLCQNIKKSEIIGYETITGILEKIKNGATKDLVEEARSFGKGTEEFQKIKEKIPTFTPNASFTNKRKLEYLHQLTGFIYLDLDEYDDLQPLKNNSYVYAIWKSISGNGYGALAKVEGVTTQNFKQCWKYIASCLKGQNIALDPQTSDITRQNVLSYDPGIYINEGCIPLEVIDIFGHQSSTTVDTIFDYQSSKTASDYPFLQTDSDTSTSRSDEKYEKPERIKYSTTLNDYEGSDCVLIPEGKKSRSGYLPKEIAVGNRRKWMVGHTISLLFNNPEISFERLLGLVNYSNKTHCSPPLTYPEIGSIVKFNYDRHCSGTLDYNTSLKKIWIDPDKKLTTHQKRKIIGKQVGILRKTKTLNELKSIYIRLKESNIKVTQKMVLSESCVSLRTIRNYWSNIVS